VNGRAFSHHFGWGAPFVVAATGIIVADIVLLAVIVVLAKVLGPIEWSNDALTAVPADPLIYLYPATAMAITLIVLCSGVVVICAGAMGLVRYFRAGRTPNATRVRWDLLMEYQQVQDREPTDAQQRAWWRSALWPEVDSADSSPGPKISTFVRSVARWRFLAANTTKVLYVLTILVTIAVVLIVLIHTGNSDWVQSNINEFNQVIIGATALLPPAILAFMWRSWSRVENRKAIGVLWDVGTFWPRSFHPFAPPSYAERAVPELLRRIWWLNENDGRVLLAGHSQGSVLAAAALLRTAEHRGHADNQNALVTFGSPVHKLYRWAFPAYLDDESLIKLAKGNAGIGQVRWRNFYYLTDVIGGPVVPRGLTPADAAATTGVDTELRDPARSTYIFGQPEPAVGGHSGYWHDETMWKAVDQVADDLAKPLIDHPESSLSGTRVARALQPIVALIWSLPLLLLRFWTDSRPFGQKRGATGRAGDREGP
jgi:hypothetical protein